MTDAVALIPARGGSKRLPRKNLLPFRGEPLLVHTVRAAVEAGLFRRVLFTSDDREMLGVAEACGATPILRPAEFATDEVGFLPAVRHALEASGEGDAAALCLLMPNCPLRTAEDVRASAEAFGACGSSFQITVFEYHLFNPVWALGLSGEGLKPLCPDLFASGARGAAPLCPSGAIWWARTRDYLEVGDFYGPNLRPFVLPWFRAVDIDTAEDYRIARIVAAAMDRDLSLFSP